MQGRVAIVTGAARGIGAAIAARLRQDGWIVAGIDRAWPGTAAGTYAADVTDFDAVGRVTAQIAADLGPVACLVNNAGITRDRFAHKMSAEDFGAVIAVNLVGAFNLCRHVLPGMREAGYGRIVCISSMNALRGQLGQCNYVAAKAGLIGLTRSLALENAGRGITANCIAPGFIETDMTAAIPEQERMRQLARIPAARAGQPADVAETAAFLASENAGFITGQVVSVNGGEFMG
jgi:acetoacetyl-CoA reductase